MVCFYVHLSRSHEGLSVKGICFCSQMGQRLMPEPSFSLISQCAYIKWGDYDFLSPGQDQPVPKFAHHNRRPCYHQAKRRVHNGPAMRLDLRRRRRTYFQGLCTGLPWSTSPLGALPPRIHIGRNANQYFCTIGNQLAQDLGEEPIVTHGNPEPPYGRLGYWK